ncbi:COX15/CtaA family protein [Granulicoccus sp. GXG6511]|uniref:COX15/CtaA family protein n=1 Tax=Granulicoccus sp. GXG6511 TaxID=3381351 RepID=UPI003D7C476D
MDVLTTGGSSVAPDSTVDRGDKGWKTLTAWSIASLVGNMALILTGALVRLTKSGLGCPTWPKCTDESFIPVGMGLHGAIEFGNRLLTFLLVALAIGTFIAALWVRHNGQRRPDIVRLSVIAALGIPAQAIIGGITVLTQLNPYVVGLHLVVSVALIVILTLLVRRARRIGPRPATPLGRRLVTASFWLMMVVIVLGVLVTGSAPHAGDDAAIRTGFDVETVAKIHAWVLWATLAVTAAAWWVTRARQVGWLIIASLFQGLVGYLQYFNGLPIWIVAFHMIGVAVIAAIAGNMYWALGTRPREHVVTSP